VTFAQLILEQQPLVDHVIRDLARQHYLASAELDEFRGAVQRALERNDYELLRAFDGRCTWATYLSTVITRQFFQFQAALWGQWRPSTAALRLGPAAILLEELVVRDRFALNDAVDWMRSTHRVDLPRHRLLELADRLGLPGTRGARRPSLSVVAGDGRIRAALSDALARLTADDRLILELRFRDRQPLTRIAALLKIDARPLQRRIDTVTSVVRQSLQTQGIDVHDIEALFDGGEGNPSDRHQKWWHLVTARPSKDR
jgi:hypothetical protein